MNYSGGQWEQPELSVPVYRGINNAKFSKDKGLGMHWSTSQPVAQRFAGGQGYVMHGEVPLTSIESDPKVLRNKKVWLHDVGVDRHLWEHEVPVKEGAPVTVTQMDRHKLPDWFDKLEEGRHKDLEERVATHRPRRSRRYKTPREMKA